MLRRIFLLKTTKQEDHAQFRSTVVSVALLPSGRGILHAGRVLTVDALTESPMFLKLSSSKEVTQQV